MKKFIACLRVLAIAIAIMLTTAVQASENTPRHVNLVEQFIAAFNAQDSVAMAKLVTNDIEWLSIVGENIVAETSGKEALVKNMLAYFESCPSCRSKLSNVTHTATRVSAIEIASWQGKDGVNSQRAICVYEFSNDLIKRVYYFPPEE